MAALRDAHPPAFEHLRDVYWKRLDRDGFSIRVKKPVAVDMLIIAAFVYPLTQGFVRLKI